MLTQLLGGDVVSACQSANLKFDIFASGSDGKYTIPRLREDSGSKGKGGQGSHQQHKNHGKGGGGGSRSANGRNRSDSVWEDPASQFCKEFNSASGCNTVPCNKKHNCNRRLRGGIFCNQKTHGKTTQDDQY